MLFCVLSISNIRGQRSLIVTDDNKDCFFEYYYPELIFGKNTGALQPVPDGIWTVYSNDNFETLDCYDIYTTVIHAIKTGYDDRGWIVYEYTKPFNGIIMLSLDKKSLIHDTGFTVTRATHDKKQRDKFYSENAQFASPGINFFETEPAIKAQPSTIEISPSANCPYCNGTGVTMSQSSGGNLSSHVAYYNSAGETCPYCGYTNKHYHTKCLH